MDSLVSMQSFLRGRPSVFKSLEDAIEWRYVVVHCIVTCCIVSLINVRTCMHMYIGKYLTITIACTKNTPSLLHTTLSKSGEVVFALILN